ncbi:MAG: lysylphosphatidylglycerol synthase transmembrane domain-containing protein [Deltaproteobacteria bacterium]|nr:lysylphosphatidylglycerol synthase transmembrane domain-containing protein [Deltaproteobacteria bacterium]
MSRGDSLAKPVPWRRWGAILLASAVSVGLLVLLFKDVDPKQVLVEAKKVDLRVFVWIYVLRAIAFFALIWRTRAVAEPLHTYRWPQATRAVFAGYFGNAVLPARIGELMKAGYLSRVGSPTPTACLAFIAVERVLDLVVIAIVALWVSFVVLNEQAGDSVVLFSLAVGTGTLVLFVLARSPQRGVEIARAGVRLLGPRADALISPRIETFLEGLSALDTARRLLPVILSTLLYWGATVATISIWPLAFGLSLPWYAPLVVMVFLSLGTAIPSTAAFAGTYHYAAAAALSLMGASRETAVAMAVFVHAATFVPWTIAAGLIIVMPLLRGQFAAKQAALRPSTAPEPMT